MKSCRGRSAKLPHIATPDMRVVYGIGVCASGCARYNHSMSENDAGSRLFCDNINISRNDEYFLMQLHSGATSTIYAFTPAHVKRLQIALSYYIAEFEKENGAVATEWPPKVTSPIQVQDLPPKPKRRPKEQ